MDDLSFLDAVLEADKDGWIGKPKEKNKPVSSTELDEFLEINDFFKEYQREPSDTGDMIEYKLSIKLEKIRDDASLHESLATYDEFNLLNLTPLYQRVR